MKKTKKSTNSILEGIVKKGTKKLTTAAIATCLALSIVTAEAKDKVKVGYLAITANRPFYSAIEKSFFEKRDIEVIPKKYQSSHILLTELYLGRIDATTVVALSNVLALEAASKKDNFRIYQVNYITKDHRTDYLIVHPDSNLTISDLNRRGMRIAHFPGPNFSHWTEEIIGNKPALFTIPPANQPLALKIGAVDALYTLEPTATSCIERGYGKVIAKGLVADHFFSPFPVTVNLLKREFIEENPDLAKRIVEAMWEGIDYTKENDKESREFLTKYCKVPQTIAQKVAVGNPMKSKDIEQPAQLEKAMRMYLDADIIVDEVNVENMLYKKTGSSE